MIRYFLILLLAVTAGFSKNTLTDYFVDKYNYAITINDLEIQKSKNFLMQCKSFKEDYPTQYNYLSSIKKFNVILYSAQHPRACAEYLPHPTGGYIVLFPNALTGSCGQSPMLILSHEMLHLAGLPVHNTYKTYIDYLAQDPIEQLMTKCELEALERKAPTSWTGESKPSKQLGLLERRRKFILQRERALRKKLTGIIYHK